MFSKSSTSGSTRDYSAEIERLKQELETAEAIVIGAGAGLSASAGISYSGERFYQNFSDFHEKYGITDMYSGGFYPFETLEEYWAWWSRHVLINRYEVGSRKVYQDLLALVQNTNYFVLTTNVDHQFQLAGFDPERLFYTQGDYGLWQCSKPCHDRLYDNESAVRQMVAQQQDMRIPTERIPRCPKCGAPMAMHLRVDDTFVENGHWQDMAKRYMTFLNQYQGQHILFLELGVGGNTPGIIKYPFWRMTLQNPHAVYVCINIGATVYPRQIESKAICINDDIEKIIYKIK